MKLNFTETPPAYTVHETSSMAARMLARCSYLAPDDVIKVSDAIMMALGMYGARVLNGAERIGMATCMGGLGKVFITEFEDASALWCVVSNDSDMTPIGYHTSESIENPPGRTVTVPTMIPRPPAWDDDKLAGMLGTLEDAFLQTIPAESIRMDVAIRLAENDPTILKELSPEFS